MLCENVRNVSIKLVVRVLELYDRKIIIFFRKLLFFKDIFD